jgi:hypothetical protein
METYIDQISNSKTVKKLTRKAKILRANKTEMYEALELVQEFFNTVPLSKFDSDGSNSIEMCKAMKALGLEID